MLNFFLIISSLPFLDSSAIAFHNRLKSKYIIPATNCSYAKVLCQHKLPRHPVLRKKSNDVDTCAYMTYPIW